MIIIWLLFFNRVISQKESIRQSAKFQKRLRNHLRGGGTNVSEKQHCP